MSQLQDLLPRVLSLPQDDPDASGRSRELERARNAYRYTYEKPNIRGLALCQSIPEEDNPSLSWRAGLAAVTARLASNAAQEAGLPGAPQLAAVTEAVKRDGLEASLNQLRDMLVRGTGDRRIGRLADYASLFHSFPVPPECGEFFLDSTFARARVAGPNPGWLRRLTPKEGLPPDFAVTEAHFSASGSQGDSLEAALAEGRLFLCEYRELLAAHAGCVPVPPAITVDYAKDPAAWDAAYRDREARYAQGPKPKALVAPLALFVLRRGQRQLTPVAIQLFPTGHCGQRYPVFTPRDGLAWTAAKGCVMAADGTVHQVISHLGRTHLVQEAFYLAIRNNLSPRHPLHRLLVPHFAGTLSINASADRVLVSPAGFVDQLLLTTIGDAIQLSGKAVRQTDFNATIFPKELKARGLDSPDALPEYPYRDDGLLVWKALSDWVTDYVQLYYGDDAAVTADVELQGLVRQVGQYQERDSAGHLCGGGLRGVGEGGPQVHTRGYLIELLTQIIWNGSAQHAAVNFPQADGMTFVPHYPLAQRAPVPMHTDFGEDEYLSLLPDYEAAHVQLFILKLLGEHHDGRLGHYPRGPAGVSHFGIGRAAECEAAFQRALESVESQIQQRNRGRMPYRYLLPSQIPQSINI